MDAITSLEAYNRAFSTRIRELSRAAVEGLEMPSELLGRSLHELGVALEALRVTEAELRRRAEPSRTASAETSAPDDRYRRLYAEAPVAFLCTDGAATIREANRAAERLLGVPELELRGTSVLTFAPADQRRALRVRLLELAGAAGEEPEEVDLTLQPRAGAERPCRASVSAARERSGEGEVELRWALRPDSGPPSTSTGEPAASEADAAPGATACPTLPARAGERGMSAERVLAGFEALPRRKLGRALLGLLRDAVASGICSGELRAGDPLPSIREITRLTTLNHKTISRAYARLAEEGLVEIRERSGIYVAEHPEWGGATARTPERDGWIAGLVRQAGERGVGIAELAGALGELAWCTGLSCACLDATEEDREMLAGELHRWFHLHAIRVSPEDPHLREVLAGVDLVVTTPFFVGRVRELEPGTAVVAVAPYPQLQAAGRATTVVCESPAFAARLTQIYGARSRVRVVRQVDASCDAGEVLATPGARGGAAGVPLAYLSAEALAGIAHTVLRIRGSAAPVARQEGAGLARIVC